MSGLPIIFHKKKSRLAVKGSEKVTLKVETSSHLLYLKQKCIKPQLNLEIPAGKQKLI